ncbi:hypothetical protein C7477_10338 [Phyllobacterium leguminum]|uniref:Uncharacterized protein n=1 Tax=Phyllobacterium leguminum TaxID=314237 RepID=A0A318T895_9HYPH|nr:hypothetical protein C7477_10338 [Phyllobacterium leguminum]
MLREFLPRAALSLFLVVFFIGIFVARSDLGTWAPGQAASDPALSAFAIQPPS